MISKIHQNYSVLIHWVQCHSEINLIYLANLIIIIIFWESYKNAETSTSEIEQYAQKMASIKRDLPNLKTLKLNNVTCFI